MTRAFVSPSHYVQTDGALDELGPRVSSLGTAALLVADDVVRSIVQERVESSFATADATLSYGQFGGECTAQEIDRLSSLARERGVDVVVGAGGGKAIDVAKAVRGQVGGTLVSLPTVASTDAPTSGLSVVYHDDGRLARGIVHDRRPELVLVDTGVVAEAPVRWFISGIGDALATRFEAAATLESGGETLAGGQPSRAGIALADQCYDVLRSSALQAVDAVRQGVVTDAVESTTEAIVLLSGVGFENGGLAAAHAVHDGVVTTIETDATHGEKVCFGLLTQLVLEDRPTATVRDIAGFASDVAILRGFDEDTSLATTDALTRAGVSAVEITANTDGFRGTLEAVTEAYGRDAAIGAGTVLDAETARAAIASGADFLVTPTFDDGVVRTANRYGVPVLTGVATPTEALKAYEAGAAMCKIFPASSLGPGFVSSLGGPLPQIPLVPTGGVSRENAPAFFDAGAVAVGIGSSIAPTAAVETGAFEEVEQRASAFLSIAREHQQG